MAKTKKAKVEVVEVVETKVVEPTAEVPAAAPKAKFPTVAANGKFQWVAHNGLFHVFNRIGQRVGEFQTENKAADFCLRSNRL